MCALVGLFSWAYLLSARQSVEFARRRYQLGLNEPLESIEDPKSMEGSVWATLKNPLILKISGSASSMATGSPSSPKESQSSEGVDKKNFGGVVAPANRKDNDGGMVSLALTSLGGVLGQKSINNSSNTLLIGSRSVANVDALPGNAVIIHGSIVGTKGGAGSPSTQLDSEFHGGPSLPDGSPPDVLINQMLKNINDSMGSILQHPSLPTPPPPLPPPPHLHHHHQHRHHHHQHRHHHHSNEPRVSHEIPDGGGGGLFSSVSG
eukprot:CAMPEP_0175044834 /NCGR_PEP_ID=MMETSP0052_2-20121109/4050_1 /TAXON_ID=51329 ORGANISM="Polytomella parva, Strain SAG 63-3" /NCGR_SAMPLE_ID=MMETSP0052_2 /ASSEMBLY_ACC=CAM_ASM_000194 /LENGTH=262 /DNA_ID=CAMNT_0016308223 /DNA_START=208 /DNA_END=994 /DNA_ORIENTATION=+